MPTNEEQEWESASNPDALMKLLGERLTLPVARRAAVGYCRTVHGPALTPDGRRWLDLIQAVADGDESDAVLEPLRTSGDPILAPVRRAVVWSLSPHTGNHYNLWFQLRVHDPEGFRAMAAQRAGPAPPDVRPGHPWHAAFGAALAAVKRELHSPDAVLTALLRCQFGNPFRKPLKFRPAWRTPTAVALARQAHDAHAFDRLPILADALEEAGCDAAELLAHLRGPGPHARGCWAVGLVLGSG